MPLYRVKFWSSSFGREQVNQNSVVCSRRGSTYYLRIYWTDFHNFSPSESALHADDGSVPYFPICRGTLPWQPNNVVVMKAN